MTPARRNFPETISCDVLILGAGLAGMRCALAARQAEPTARVLVVWLLDGPSGSSFANANNALGMQYCRNDDEARAFVAEAIDLARPGSVSPRLVQILAEDSAARLADLEELGLDFVRLADGAIKRHHGCFSTAAPRAAVFTGLGSAQRAFAARARALGVDFLPGHRVLALLSDSAPVSDGTSGGASGGTSGGTLSREPDQTRPRVAGALLGREDGGCLAVSARSVVLALGGPAPLCKLNQAGPGNPGYAYALLERAGAALANAGYLQWMWATPDKVFWPLARLAEKGLAVARPVGDPESVCDAPVLPGLAELAAARANHCPFGYDLQDARLDLYLAECIQADHFARLRLPGGEAIRVAPMAHAGNGGAAIDEFGRTTVPGLYAVGECAGQMHGANRLGGAMVLATQVFGTRAGGHAAKAAPGASNIIRLPEFAELAGETFAGLTFDPSERLTGLARLAEGLQRFCILGGRPGLAAFAQALEVWHRGTKDHCLRLAIETARIIVRAQLYPAGPNQGSSPCVSAS